MDDLDFLFQQLDEDNIEGLEAPVPPPLGPNGIPLAPPPPPPQQVQRVVARAAPVAPAQPGVAVAQAPLKNIGLDLGAKGEIKEYVEYVPRDGPVTLKAPVLALPVMNTMPYGGLVLSKSHLQKPIKQLYEDPTLLAQLRDIDSRELMQVSLLLCCK